MEEPASVHIPHDRDETLPPNAPGRCVGTLDQGIGILEILEEQAPSTVYAATLDTFQNIEHVVSTLFNRSTQIAA